MPRRTGSSQRWRQRQERDIYVEQASREISAIARRIHDTTSERNEYLLTDGGVVPLRDSITGRARTPLLVLLGAVGFLLLVACANVANLLLAQVSARERELAVRSALGAPRHRILSLVVNHAMRLASLGLVLGLGGAVLLSQLLQSLLFEIPPRDPVTLAAVAILLLTVSLAAAGVPAWRAVRIDPVVALKGE